MSTIQGVMLAGSIHRQPRNHRSMFWDIFIKPYVGSKDKLIFTLRACDEADAIAQAKERIARHVEWRSFMVSTLRAKEAEQS